MNYLKEHSKELKYKKYHCRSFENKAVVYCEPYSPSYKWVKTVFKCPKCGEFVLAQWSCGRGWIEDVNFLKNRKCLSFLWHDKCFLNSISLPIKQVSLKRFIYYYSINKKFWDKTSREKFEEILKNELLKRV